MGSIEAKLEFLRTEKNYLFSKVSSLVPSGKTVNDYSIGGLVDLLAGTGGYIKVWKIYKFNGSSWVEDISKSGPSGASISRSGSVTNYTVTLSNFNTTTYRPLCGFFNPFNTSGSSTSNLMYIYTSYSSTGASFRYYWTGSTTTLTNGCIGIAYFPI